MKGFRLQYLASSVAVSLFCVCASANGPGECVAFSSCWKIANICASTPIVSADKIEDVHQLKDNVDGFEEPWFADKAPISSYADTITFGNGNNMFMFEWESFNEKQEGDTGACIPIAGIEPGPTGGLPMAYNENCQEESDAMCKAVKNRTVEVTHQKYLLREVYGFTYMSVSNHGAKYPANCSAYNDFHCATKIDPLTVNKTAWTDNYGFNGDRLYPPKDANGEDPNPIYPDPYKPFRMALRFDLDKMPHGQWDLIRSFRCPPLHRLCWMDERAVLYLRNDSKSPRLAMESYRRNRTI